MCFWQNVYRSSLLGWNIPCPEKFLVACLHSDIILFAKWCILNTWLFWICHCLYNCPVISTETLCYVLHQTHSELRYIKNCLFWYMQAYSSIFSIIKAYSAPCVALANLQPFHILNCGIFRTGDKFKFLWTFTKHIQNPDIFRTVYSGVILADLEPCISLVYGETWHIENPEIFRSFP